MDATSVRHLGPDLEWLPVGAAFARLWVHVAPIDALGWGACSTRSRPREEPAPIWWAKRNAHRQRLPRTHRRAVAHPEWPSPHDRSGTNSTSIHWGARPGERPSRRCAVDALRHRHANLERLPQGLSGGERQRVALGRALAVEPSGSFESATLLVPVALLFLPVWLTPFEALLLQIFRCSTVAIWLGFKKIPIHQLIFQFFMWVFSFEQIGQIFFGYRDF